MAKKKIAIIGAGISGLSAGCYLQMNGFQTEIYELHSIPGGLCTTWKKGGYTFDGCLHSFGALNPGTRLNSWWKEIIDLDALDFYFHEELSQIIDTDGSRLRLPTDPDQLGETLKAIAPDDGKFIDGMVKSIKRLSRFDMTLAKPLELWTPLDYYLSQFRTAPYLLDLMKWGKPMAELTARCKSEKLKKVLDMDFFSHFPAFFFLLSVGEMHKKNAGYPVSGSLQIALMMEEKFKVLGGMVYYNAKVDRVRVVDNRAVGITLENGESFDADFVISAADGYDTIYRMLDGKYTDKKVDTRYAEHPMWSSAVLVSLGVARDFKDEAGVLELWLDEPLVVDSASSLEYLPVTIYNFDPTLAESGKTCIRAILKTPNHSYWWDLRENNPEIYAQEKDRVAQAFIEILDQRLGGIKENLEVIDVATPATFIRYTNNWKGSTQGWDWVPSFIPESMSKELPGLKGFYMIGQWVFPGGGVSTAFMMGRDIARIICKREGRKFKIND